MSNEASKETRNSRGALVSLVYFLGVALLVVGIYWVMSDEAPSTEVEAAPETTTTTAPILKVDSPSYVAGEEPIADAAEIILPSVVHVQTPNGLGAGVIYDASGLILTAAHVVDGNDTVRIRLDNGDQVEGQVLGTDTDVDIAVIQIDVEGVTPATLNVDKPRVGQLAVAVGSPWGLESTVTAGIVSAVDQANCEFNGCYSMVQTDAAINPGNSGGPLVDRHGQVIGINVSIFTESGANDGVGFAVPASIAKLYADAIVSGEPVEAAFLGVSGTQNLEGQAGALITEVFPDTAAAEAGIQVGDIVISVGGVSVQGIDDLAAQMRAHQAGDVVELVLLRDGVETVLEVTLGVRTEELS